MARPAASLSRSARIGLAVALAIALLWPAPTFADVPPGAAPDGPPTALTTSGPVVGTRESGVEVFKGIPYAAPPIGPLRWRKPRPAPLWTAPRVADAFGPACPQPARGIGIAVPGRQDEDCLTLNLWRPAGAAAAPSGGGLPIMVWLHGGANQFGSAAQPVYDGTSFARDGVILVSINYRLGYLGFFAHPALTGTLAEDERGNYGLMDQVAALAWVQANASAFGGDPARVTVFGESAGGAAVILLLQSPKGRGLFARAIVQSGGGDQRLRSLQTMEAEGVALARELGLDPASTDAESLRAVPADRFLAVGAAREPRPGFGPARDGVWVAAAPADKPEMAAVPLIIGTNSGEGSLVDAYRIDTGKGLALLRGEDQALRAAYGAEAQDDAAYLRALYRDLFFAAPARDVAQRRARAAGGDGAPTWLYVFDYQFARRRSALGAPHGFEIPFVFDSIDRLPMARLAATGEDRAMAAIMHGCWVAFAKTGAPNGAEACAAWRPVRPDATPTFLFAETSAVVEDYRKSALDAAVAHRLDR